MKFTQSKDGASRATIVVKYRIDENELRYIARVFDKRKDIEPTDRKASREEAVTAIKDGFFSNMDWGIED